MTFVPNPNFEDQFAQMVIDAKRRLAGGTLDAVQAQYAGQPVDVVRPALAQAVADSNDGANISEPTLSLVAEAISERRRVWVDERAHIMIDDGQG